MKVLVISGEYIFCCPKPTNERYEKSKSYFWTHKWGGSFVARSLSSGAKSWIQNLIHLQKCLGSATRIPEALDTDLLLGWSGWCCKVLPKHQKKKGKNLENRIFLFLFLKNFLSFTRLSPFLWTPQICRRRRNTKKQVLRSTSTSNLQEIGIPSS